jgi:uncharacterized small protein (DUF1192 family)
VVGLAFGSVDSKRTKGESAFAMDDDDRPRLTRDAASQLAGESLDRYSQDELGERIALLEAEIARVKAHRDRANSHRAAAEALFRPRPS